MDVSTTALLLARWQFAFTVSFHIIFPGHLDRAGELPGRARRPVAADTPHRVPRPLQLLEEDLRGRLRHGRGVRPGHELPVRHQLECLLRQGGPGDRPAHGLRSALRLFPRGRFPRRDALRPETRRSEAAFLRDVHGRIRHLHLGLLDPRGQQLDADAAGFRGQRRGPIRADGLVGGDLQSRRSRTGSSTWCSART